MNETNYWSTLKADFMNHIRAEVIKPQGEIKRYSRSMDLLIQFADSNGCVNYSPNVGVAFYESEQQKNYIGDSTIGYRRACIRNLNKFLYGNTFWQRKPRNLFKYNTSEKLQPPCPAQFTRILEAFLDCISRRGLKEITVLQYRNTCVAILQDFDSQGVKSWDCITTEHLTTAFKRATNKHHFITYSKQLFQYLCDEGIIGANYALILPRMAKKKCLPSVYNEDEVKALIRSIETFTPQGKRDYAMLLMALRLGLRQSDIRELRFENVDFERSQVNLVQFKTGVALQLSLPDAVADALHDYINNGREKSDSLNIFINGHGAPFTRQAVTHIIARHFKQANINIGSRHYGPHALRMTFASQLVEEKVPYEVVRTLLGQVSTSSTKHYVEFSTEGLRTCALEVPAPGSIFAKYLLEVQDVN